MKKLITTASLITAGMMGMSAHAGVSYDSHGNVGYDTLAECQAAINSGAAKFYESMTHKKPMIRAGEASVTKGRLGDLAPQYAKGTCDLGTGHRAGRDGVAKALQGKYIPYSPDMVINQYRNSAGRIVRVSMAQCDNWFSAPIPQGMPVTPQPAPIEPVVVEPTVTVKPVPAPPTVTTVPVAPPAPVVAPAPAPVVPSPTSAVSAAAGSIPAWVPVTAIGVIGIALAASSGDDDDNSGTTGTK